MSCLQERLGGLRALTNVFSEANGEVVENAVSAVNALGPLDRCADVPLLRAVVRPPEDPSTLARVLELRHRLADSRARFNAGRWKEAIKTAPGLVTEVRAAGYQPLVAETLTLFGTMSFKSNDTKTAEQALTEAFWAADASRHDEVRAEAAAEPGLRRRLSGRERRRCPALGSDHRRSGAAEAWGRTSCSRLGSSTTSAASTICRGRRRRS